MSSLKTKLEEAEQNAGPHSGENSIAVPAPPPPRRQLSLRRSHGHEETVASLVRRTSGAAGTLNDLGQGNALAELYAARSRRRPPIEECAPPD